MTLLLSMPGGSEWILIILVLLLTLTMPILAIVLYSRNRELRRQIEILRAEKNELLANIMNRQ